MKPTNKKSAFIVSKTLLLMRHAKSSWQDSSLADHDRPLNGRGRDAAKRIGIQLIESKTAIDLILCSTAVRTRETAALVFADPATSPPITYQDDLYHASPAQMIQQLHRLPESIHTVMVITHNPGLEEFLLQLTGESAQFPTGALARIDLELDTWSQFNRQTRGQKSFFWLPREMDAD